MQSHATSKCIQCVHQVSNFVDPTSRPPISNVSNHKWKVCCRAYCEAIFSQKTPTPLSRNNPHNDTWFRKKKAIQTCKQQVGNKLIGIAGGAERPQSVNHQFRFNKSIIPQMRYQCNPRLLVPSSVHAHAQRIRNYLSSTCNQLWNLIKRISQLVKILTIHSTAK